MYLHLKIKEKKKVSYVNLGGFSEGTHGVNVIVEDNDTHHNTHAEQHSVCVGETAPVFPTYTKQRSHQRCFIVL